MTTTPSNMRKPTRREGWRAAAEASAQAEAEQAHPPRRFNELLPVKLTDAELTEKAKRAAIARRRVAEYEAQHKAASDGWKHKIKTAEVERDELLDTIDRGVEERPVECIETFDWRLGSVFVHRADTGEKLRERAMTAAERQPSLPHTDPSEPPASHDGDEPEGSSGTDEAAPEEALAAADEVEAELASERDPGGIADAFLHETDDLDELEGELDAVVDDGTVEEGVGFAPLEPGQVATTAGGDGRVWRQAYGEEPVDVTDEPSPEKPKRTRKRKGAPS